MTNKIALASSSTLHPDYSEPVALQSLLRNLTRAADEANDRFEETGEWFASDLCITVAGKTTAFSLGGPQMTAIEKFVASIAEENGYEVLFLNDTVTE